MNPQEERDRDYSRLHSRLQMELGLGWQASEYIERGITDADIDEWNRWMKRPGKSQRLARWLMKERCCLRPPKDDPIESHVPLWAEARHKLYRVWADLWPSSRLKETEWELFLEAIGDAPDAIAIAAAKRIRRNEDPYKQYRASPHPSVVRRAVEDVQGRPQNRPQERAEERCDLKDVLAAEGASSLSELLRRRET